MRPPVAEIVDVDALWKTVVTAIVAAVGVTLAFSVAVLGWVRSLESRRDERTGGSVGWALLAVLGLAVAVPGIVLGMMEVVR